MSTRTGAFAAALALTAATTVTVTPAYAAPATVPTKTAETATVEYATAGTGPSATGSLDSEFVQIGLTLVAGIGVSIALAVGAGVAGGAIELPQIPGLPF